MTRDVIHLNIADFAAAVTRTTRPGTGDGPLIIAPPGAARALVYDMNEEAFQAGVRKGMPLAKAGRLCPGSPVLPLQPHRYEKIMTALVKLARAHAPLVESGLDDGHLFLDVTGTSRLSGPPCDVARRLAREIKMDFDLDPIWSVASNKLVAKAATRTVKPYGACSVNAGDEIRFLSPLPLALIPGLTVSDLTRLHSYNFLTAAHVLALDMDQLSVAVGSRAQAVYEIVRGIDRSAVCPLPARSRFRADHEFATDAHTVTQLKKGLYTVIAPVCRTLRERSRLGAAAAMTLTYSDGILRRAVIQIHPPTADDMEMFRACLPLLYKAWNRRVRIRHMELACTRTLPVEIQLSLFSSPDRYTRQRRLSIAIDRIRTRFGPCAVAPAVTLSR